MLAAVGVVTASVGGPGGAGGGAGRGGGSRSAARNLREVFREAVLALQFTRVEILDALSKASLLTEDIHACVCAGSTFAAGDLKWVSEWTARWETAAEVHPLPSSGTGLVASVAGKSVTSKAKLLLETLGLLEAA